MGKQWSYRLVVHGAGCECTVRLDGDVLHWHTTPDGEDEKPGLPCAQPLEDFRRFGPPETPEYLAAQGDVLGSICAAIGLFRPAWLEPLPNPLPAWFMAAGRGDIATMGELLQAGVAIDALDRQHRSALWHAALQRGTALTAWLLDRGADPNIRGRYGGTLLMHAAVMLDEEKAELYLKYQADKKALDAQGRSAYLIAIESKAGGNLVSALSSYDAAEWMAGLKAAAQGCHVAWFNSQNWYFDRHRPNINSRGNPFHRTPLQLCLRGFGRHPLVARWLVERGADLAVADEEDQATILHLAALENMPWLVAPCIRAGVQVDQRRRDGETALSLALSGNERPALVRALLEAGARPDTKVGGESIGDRASRLGLVWSAWQMGDSRRTWSGLCTHAVVAPSGVEPPPKFDSAGDAFWLEFPAEWCLEANLVSRLKKCADAIAGRDCAVVRILAFAESSQQPWSWPGRKLFAVFPDETFAPVVRFRDERPRAMLSDPLAYGKIEQIERKWQWSGRDWNARFGKYSLKLRRGGFTWCGYNLHLETPVDQFRVQGPPPGCDLDTTIPLSLVDEICACIGEWKRTWEAPASAEERKAQLKAWKAAQPQPIAENDVPEMLSHHSGLWCYAKLEIEDRFNTRSGAGSDGEWTCWAEFPAEWCATRMPYLEHWLKMAMRRAYEVMNRKAANDDDGGTYIFNRCFATVLTLDEARQQPWTARGKVLYLVTDRERPPEYAEGARATRDPALMADPELPPEPRPI